MIRVGIVGYGFAGRGFHAPLIARVPGLSVAAVATRSSDRRAEAEIELGCATFETLEAMLEADACDVVVLATPHDVHAPQATMAMRAGRHVVIDKPMTLHAAEADALIAERDAAGVLLSVFHNRRWDWDFLTVKGLVAEGAIGSPTLFETAVMRYKPPRGWRATTSAGGGLQYDWGAHLVDQAFQLVAGPLASVVCDIQHRAWGADAGSYVRMLLRFESGVLYSIEIGNLAAIGKPRWYVLGEAGAISKWGLDPQEPALLKGDISKAAEPAMDHAKVVSMGPEGPVTRSIPSVRGDWTGYYENIRDAIAGHAPLAVTAEEARRVIATLEAATESAHTGQPVIPTYR